MWPKGATHSFGVELKIFDFFTGLWFFFLPTCSAMALPQLTSETVSCARKARNTDPLVAEGLSHSNFSGSLFPGGPPLLGFFRDMVTDPV